MKKVVLILSLILFTGIHETQALKKIWTVEEIMEWYNENCTDPETTWCSGMYYQGSTEKFHYFAIRNFDRWVFIKIRVKEITLEKIEPKTKFTSENRNKGFYKVDPLNNFEEIKEN